MTVEIRGISSMATRLLLATLIEKYARETGRRVVIESVGGVDAAKRVQAGEMFDFVVLASDAVERLMASGHVVPDSSVEIVQSGVAVAVRAGAAAPDISSANAVREAVIKARSISYSTGPSGVALAGLFERWGIADAVRNRLVVAPPGVPVGALVARGDVELGFQQFSELLHLQGLLVVGPLPADIQITTSFCAGICTASRQAEDVRVFFDFMNSPGSDGAKREQGMEPAAKRQN